ncbi:MAG: hypothetical protein C5B43_00480 [Verrucomicrobia bacterium]|nr:MAG: hypothetical protein C5B43_00480 [Verrucomicrobiota bacterium]
MKVKLLKFVCSIFVCGILVSNVQAVDVEGVEIVKLDVPSFSEAQVVNKKLGMKVMTHITVRAKVHYYKGEPIIVVDNYGYGGNKWTYAPGSVELAYEQMKKGCQLIRKSMIPHEEKVTVLGGGVDGIMLANRLAKEGFKVTVYAEQFSPNTLSDIKIGVFLPFLNEEDKKDKIKTRLEELSYRTYADWFELKGEKNKSIRPIDLYIVDESGKVNLPRKSEIIPNPSIINLEIGFKESFAALKYKSFAIDTGRIMTDMMEEGRRLGVNFVKMNVDSVDRFMANGSGIIFNCIGLELKEKEEREEMSLISHTMCIEGGKGMEYAIYVKHENGNYTCLFPGKDNAVNVTGTFFEMLEKNASEADNVKRLVSRANQTFKRNSE